MVITLINQGDTQRQAFVRGFWKGMAAPMMLFAANGAIVGPVDLPPLRRVEPVRLPESLTTMTDLQRIGADFAAVVGRYEQEGQKQPSIGGKTG